MKKAVEAQGYGKNLEALRKLGSYMQTQNALLAETQILDEIRASESAARDNAVLEKVKELVRAGLQFAAAPGLKAVPQAEGEEEQSQEEGEPKAPYPELKSAYEVAMQKLEESIASNESKILGDGSSIFLHTKYERAQEVVKDSLTGAYGPAYDVIKAMVALENISGKKMVDKESELREIEQMLDAVKGEYKAMLAVGEPQDYAKAKKEGESQRTLDGLKSEYIKSVTEKQDEIKKLEEVKELALEGSQAKIDSINELLKYLNEAKSGGKLGDFRAELVENVDELIRELTEKIAALQAELAGGTDQEKLSQELGILREGYQDALDKGDLAKAGQLEEKLKALAKEGSEKTEAAVEEYVETQSKIKALEKQAAAETDQAKVNQINQQIASLQVKANSALGGLEEGKLATLNDLNEAVSQAKEQVKNSGLTSDTSLVKQTINSIAESAQILGTDYCDAALKDIADTIAAKVAGSEECSPGLSELGAKANAIRDGGFSALKSAAKTESEIEGEIADILDAKTEISGFEKQAIKLVALSEAGGKTGDAVYSNLFNAELQKAVSSGNLQITKKLNQTYKGSTELCIPLRAVGKLAGYDYVWHEDYSVAYLSGTKAVYRFNDGSDMVEKGRLSSATEAQNLDYEKEQMASKAKFKLDFYVPGGFVEDEFEIKVKDLPQSCYAVIFSADHEGVYGSLLEKLTGKAT